MRQLKITNKITNRDSESIKSYLSEISKIERINEQEELELSVKSMNGDMKARKKLINSNLRFVISVAKQYQNQGLLFEDLVNEGNYGLVKAAERFDHTRGFKFISYAVWWIRQSILEALANDSRLIRLPTNQITSLHKLNKEILEFEQRHEREPTEEEISEIMQEDIVKVSRLIRSSKRHSSLDAPLKTDEENYSLYDVISVEEENNIDRKIEDDSLKSDMESVLKTLSSREREIVCMYYGLMNYPKMTLEEIGEYFELTRERVRQIKDKTIKVLRHRSRSKILKQHLK
jgi:RNA polymerase primary sigma factor